MNVPVHLSRVLIDVNNRLERSYLSSRNLHVVEVPALQSGESFSSTQSIVFVSLDSGSELCNLVLGDQSRVIVGLDSRVEVCNLLLSSQGLDFVRLDLGFEVLIFASGVLHTFPIVSLGMDLVSKSRDGVIAFVVRLDQLWVCLSAVSKLRQEADVLFAEGVFLLHAFGESIVLFAERFVVQLLLVKDLVD